MALLEASGIGKNFGETKVLKDISLTLEQGEALAIIGSSGSGTDAAARRISAYVGSFDSALKRYFALLDDPAAAESEVRRIYGELAGTAGGKASY